MTNQMAKRMMEARRKTLLSRPLIHCITNPISINDCANAILSVGARPIMAEHPREVAEITSRSDALVINIGNITDVRMESMLTSGITARQNGIPIVFDAVGAAVSTLRLNYAKNYIVQCRPNVVKGNISELLALMDMENHAVGIDAGECDQRKSNEDTAQLLAKYARGIGASVLCTGRTDIVTDGSTAYALSNGCEMLTHITGTGCMVGALAGAFAAVSDGLCGAMMGVSSVSIAGEYAGAVRGTGSYKTALFDKLSTLDEYYFFEALKGELVYEEL